MNTTLLPKALLKKLESRMHSFSKRFRKKIAEVQPVPGQSLEDFVTESTEDFYAVYAAEAAQITSGLTTEERLAMGDELVWQHIRNVSNRVMMRNAMGGLSATDEAGLDELAEHLVGWLGTCGNSSCPDCGGGKLLEPPGGNPARN